jgi:hypothetical protein
MTRHSQNKAFADALAEALEADDEPLDEYRFGECENHDPLIAELGLEQLQASMRTAAKFARHPMLQRDLDGALHDMHETRARVKEGDLSDSESLLAAHNLALDAIFNENARYAAAKMDKYLPAVETHLRLALKAQAQCRANVATLVAARKPRRTA